MKQRQDTPTHTFPFGVYDCGREHIPSLSSLNQDTGKTTVIEEIQHHRTPAKNQALHYVRAMRKSELMQMIRRDSW